MAALPDEVVATLATTQHAQDEVRVDRSDDAQHNSLIRRVFSSLAKLLAQATEADENDGTVESGSNKAECTDNNSLNYGYPAYGYPPAYGVPANVAVKLLSEAFKLLEKVMGEVEDKELAEAINDLRNQIGQALGIAAQLGSVPDFVGELKLAVTVSLATQPVLPPTEAAERLKNAWVNFVDVLSFDKWLTSTGRLFEAAFALRAAIEAAMRSLGAIATQAALQDEVAEASKPAETKIETETETETVQSNSNEQQSVDDKREEMGASAQGSEKVEDANADADAASGQCTETGDGQVVASAADADAPQENACMTDDRLAGLIREALAPIVSRIEELTERIEAVENAAKNRRRVSSFIASSNKQNNEDDIWRKWLMASEKERKLLLKEAQKLLAAPIPIDRD